MKAKNVLILLLAALAMTACDYDDSALWEQVNQNTEDINQNTEDIAAQAERIAALEAWQAETNTNIQSLQTLLSTPDYITAVTPVMENGAEVGYTISFLNSDPITIYHADRRHAGRGRQLVLDAERRTPDRRRRQLHPRQRREGRAGRQGRHRRHRCPGPARRQRRTGRQGRHRSPRPARRQRRTGRQGRHRSRRRLRPRTPTLHRFQPEHSTGRRGQCHRGRRHLPERGRWRDVVPRQR